MRIGIDARFYNQETGGISRVIRELLKNLIELDKKNTYIVFVLEKDLQDFQEKAPNIELKVSQSPYYTLKEHSLFPKEISEAQVDLMHFLNFNVPFNCPVPYLVTIHDLTLFFFPGRKRRNPFFKAAYKIIMANAIKKARYVHAITEYTKQDIQKIFHTPSDKIRVIYEGVNANFQPVRSKETLQKALNEFGIKTPYLMYHGAWRKHKNIVNLLTAFAKFLSTNQADNFSLVLASKKDLEYPEIMRTIDKNDLGDRVIITDQFIGDQDLAGLLSGCTAYVFPSLYEGFGLTPLEAMACGAPVLSSDSSCMPEVLGDAAYYFDAKDIQDIKTAMARMCFNQQLQKEFSERSLQQVRKYSWAKMTKEILKLYNSF